MHDILIQQMKDEVVRFGVKELKTPEEVDDLVAKQKGTVLIFVNSVCGCAGGIARPALRMALSHPKQPDVVATVFASTDREATARARSYFTGMPPSSPSFGLLKDGKLVHMIHRHDIEMRMPEEIADAITGMIDRYAG